MVDTGPQQQSSLDTIQINPVPVSDQPPENCNIEQLPACEQSVIPGHTGDSESGDTSTTPPTTPEGHPKKKVRFLLPDDAPEHEHAKLHEPPPPPQEPDDGQGQDEDAASVTPMGDPEVKESLAFLADLRSGILSSLAERNTSHDSTEPNNAEDDAKQKPTSEEPQTEQPGESQGPGAAEQLIAEAVTELQNTVAELQETREKNAALTSELAAARDQINLQSTALSEAATIMESLQSEKQDFQTQTERIIQDLTKAHQEEVEKLKKEINRLTELAKEQEHATHLQEKKTTQPQPSATPSEPKRSISTQDSKPPTETLPTSKPAASSSNHPAHPTPVTKPQEQPKPKPQEPSQPTSAPSNSAIPPASTVPPSDGETLKHVDEKLLIRLGFSNNHRDIKEWISTLGMPLGDRDLFAAIADGATLLKILDAVRPGIVEWKRVTKPIGSRPLNLFQTAANLEHALACARNLGGISVRLVSKDILDTKKTLVLGFLSDLKRVQQRH